MDEAYVRAVMRFFVHLYGKGWIYRANRIINWCPFHLTSLSDLEVAHIDVDDALTYVRYPLADGDGHITIATVRPATILVPKVTLKDAVNIDLFGGVVQSATADAVVDCLIEGVIPKDIANELCIISLVWIDPRCAKDPNLDKKDMYRTNHEATMLAIRRALNNEPSIDELIANRHTIKHDMDDWS
jgi:formaldehyde-activating enzyme